MPITWTKRDGTGTSIWKSKSSCSIEHLLKCGMRNHCGQSSLMISILLKNLYPKGLDLQEQGLVHKSSTNNSFPDRIIPEVVAWLCKINEQIECEQILAGACRIQRDKAADEDSSWILT